jgi:hypothetical protein
MEGIDRSRSTCRLVTVTNELQNRITQKQSMYPPGFPRKVRELYILIYLVHFSLYFYHSMVSSNILKTKHRGQKSVFPSDNRHRRPSLALNIKPTRFIGHGSSALNFSNQDAVRVKSFK